ncbi:MAG: FAD-dependent oxidoreductase [Candidatus Omnitrophota bacterium]|jgi:NADH dehydrogenase
MKKVVIVGCGFAGATAMKKLSPFKSYVDVTLVDRKKTFDFLPELPDCLGRGIKPEYLTYSIEDMVKSAGFQFVNDEVISMDMQKQRFMTRKGKLDYDYAIIASGSETNFYGNDSLRRAACKLDNISDTEAVAARLKEKEYAAYIIAGGGYTGAEVASNISIFLEKRKRTSKIIIVERSNTILTALPEWMKEYAYYNFKRLNVDIMTDSQIEKIEGSKVYLSGGKVFDDALVVWTAGVKTADFIQSLSVKKNSQGRVEVDEYLRINNNCYVVGDAAHVRQKGVFLRMAVQFAISQADRAVKNIIRDIKGKKPLAYRTIDLGYIIPMANNRSCGNTLGVNVSGYLATLLHFLMCFYRSYNLRKGFGIIKGFLTNGG